MSQLQTDLQTILHEAKEVLRAATSVPVLDQVKAKFVGKSGSITEQMKLLGKLDPDARKAAGAAINEVKNQVEELINGAKSRIQNKELEAGIGGLHPVTRTLERIEALFASMGFSVAEGPEIETDYFNFSALNTPEKHPARSMHDTFYIEGSKNLLRTHTSPVQIRHMQLHKPPIRIICPGRVYRCDHDATHSPMFHQLEGLWVDEGISLADLKGTLTQFLNAFFERDDMQIRFRPSYFPFVEPGVEVDMEWENKGGKIKWLEIGGAGVVHPQVLRNGGIDPERYSGFAFGMGLDRLAMLKYGVNDLRLFFENDVKFLSQFR
jgi:phenylalanyl-tRNA synthetase alpha chain